jgi:hypothetical protein
MKAANSNPTNPIQRLFVRRPIKDIDKKIILPTQIQTPTRNRSQKAFSQSLKDGIGNFIQISKNKSNSNATSSKKSH